MMKTARCKQCRRVFYYPVIHANHKKRKKYCPNCLDDRHRQANRKYRLERGKMDKAPQGISVRKDLNSLAVL
jgi:predicted sulfurtransferase